MRVGAGRQERAPSSTRSLPLVRSRLCMYIASCDARRRAEIERRYASSVEFRPLLAARSWASLRCRGASSEPAHRDRLADRRPHACGHRWRLDGAHRGAAHMHTSMRCATRMHSPRRPRWVHVHRALLPRSHAHLPMRGAGVRRLQARRLLPGDLQVPPRRKARLRGGYRNRACLTLTLTLILTCCSIITLMCCSSSST